MREIGTASADREEGKGTLQDGAELSRVVLQQREDLRQEGVGAHGDASGRDGGDLAIELAGVSEVAFESDRAERRPDEALGDGFLAGAETAEIGVGFELFEEQLDLPAQSVDLQDLLFGQSLRIDIGHDSHPLVFMVAVASGVTELSHDEAKAAGCAIGLS